MFTRRLFFSAFFAFFLSASLLAQIPTTTWNDDTCDISQGPAATLLLPRFEVGLGVRADAIDTAFTLVNTRQEAQIAHVTLWTDRGYPVLGFNLLLHAYDLQTVSLYDVIVTGALPPLTAAGVEDNPNADFTNCAEQVHLSTAKKAAVRSALTTGIYNDGTVNFPNVGDVHTNAIGYATVDVAGVCSSVNPISSAYFDSVIMFDNSLTGEYSIVDPVQNSAHGTSMVHIRAVPEGGSAGSFAPTNLPFTFYDRFTPESNRTADRRQPLPNTFVTRWNEGGYGGHNASITIWREGTASAAETQMGQVGENAILPFVEIVRFDEQSFQSHTTAGCVDCPTTNLSSRNSVEDFALPDTYGTFGWLYLNMNNGGSDAYSDARTSGTSQAWVITDMLTDQRFQSSVEATALGNGCSPAPPVSDSSNPINPAPNANTSFFDGHPATTNNDDSCEVSLAPAATLLLPNFEVELGASYYGDSTIVYLLNTSEVPQIANIVLWTDRGFPVLSFNAFMPGYDTLAFNLHDIIGRGDLPSTSSNMSHSDRALWNAGNPLHQSLANCSSLPTEVPESLLPMVQSALTTGNFGALTGVGNAHQRAIGYMTVDVVDSCTTINHLDPAYFTSTILFDNVLTGDVLYHDLDGNVTAGMPLVHVRAIPEGGTQGSAYTSLPFTFYDRFTPPGNRQIDRRQPLPGVFAAPYVQNEATFASSKIRFWREGIVPASAVATGDVAPNATIPFVEVVRVDANENVTVRHCVACGTSESGIISVDDAELMPPAIEGSPAGWLYLNFNNGESGAYSEARTSGGTHAGVSQNWISMQQDEQGRYKRLVDAAAIVNACSPAEAIQLDLRAPKDVVATATGATTVQVTWTAVPGASGYEVERRSASGTTIIPHATTSFTDSVSVGSAALYRVRTLRAAHPPSAYSKPDLATTIAFTDPSIVAHTTSVRVVHVAELRTAVNAVRALTSLGTFSFTDPDLGGKPIRALHVTQLRSALDAARSSLGLAPIAYANSVSSGTTIRRSDVVSLREGVR